MQVVLERAQEEQTAAAAQRAARPRPAWRSGAAAQALSKNQMIRATHGQDAYSPRKDVRSA